MAAWLLYLWFWDNTVSNYSHIWFIVNDDPNIVKQAGSPSDEDVEVRILLTSNSICLLIVFWCLQQLRITWHWQLLHLKLPAIDCGGLEISYLTVMMELRRMAVFKPISQLDLAASNLLAKLLLRRIPLLAQRCPYQHALKQFMTCQFNLCSETLWVLCWLE